MSQVDHKALLEFCERELQSAHAAIHGAKPATTRFEKWADVPEALALPYAQVQWLVDGILPLGGFTVLAGESGVGKTWFALLAALAVARGGTFLGRACRPAPVLYLDRENPVALVYQRLAKLGALPADPQAPRHPHLAPQGLRLWGGWCGDPPPLLGDARLLAMAAEARPLLVVDSLIRFHEMDENSATGMATVMGAVRALCNAGATVLVLHHKPKNSSSHYRGSSDIHAGADVNFSLSRNAEKGTLRLACFKNRHQQEETLLLRPDFDAGGDYRLADPETEAATEASAALAADSEALFARITAEPGLSQKQIIDRCGLPEKRVRKLLQELQGQLWRVETATRGAHCYYPLTPAQETLPLRVD